MYRLIVVAVLAALASAACSAQIPGTPVSTNGLERKTSAEVEQEAAAALRAATSVRISGVTEDKSGEIEVRIQGSKGSGSLTLDGARVEIVKIDETVYVRGDAQALTAMSLPPEVARLGAVKWLNVGRQRRFTLDGFSVDDLANQLTDSDSPLHPQVKQSVLNGRKVVVIDRQDGTKLYVANVGPAYPVRGIRTGNDAGQIDFMDYGADFQITMPAAVELSRLATGPALAEEFRWLDAISAMRLAMDKALVTPSSEWYEQEVVAIVDTLRRCGRELVQPQCHVA